METDNGTAQHHTVEQVAQQACQAANQADDDCMALASMLEEVRAENAELRKRLARAEEFIGTTLRNDDERIENALIVMSDYIDDQECMCEFTGGGDEMGECARCEALRAANSLVYIPKDKA